jgi:hypothetical protein
LARLLNKEVLEEGNSNTKNFFTFPEDMNLNSMQAYIENISEIDDPQIFGLHSNADIKFKKETTL